MRGGATRDDDIIISSPDLGATELRCEVWGELIDHKGEEDEDEDEDDEI